MLCKSLETFAVRCPLGSELSNTGEDSSPANAGECINAIGLVKPKCSTKEEKHSEVSDAVC